MAALPTVRFSRCNLSGMFFIFRSYTLVSLEKISPDQGIHQTMASMPLSLPSLVPLGASTVSIKVGQFPPFSVFIATKFKTT